MDGVTGGCECPGGPCVLCETSLSQIEHGPVKPEEACLKPNSSGPQRDLYRVHGINLTAVY